LEDAGGPPLAEAERVLLCCGKIYYELLERREKLGRRDVALIRLEQLFPFPRRELEALLVQCREDTNVIWVQEEPDNMGAWRFLRVTVSMQFLDRLPFSGITRPAAASPATGSAAAHQIEQEDLLARAFAPATAAPRPRHEATASAKQLIP
jgi:2-oxoglutarate dehydrogenase E1 component